MKPRRREQPEDSEEERKFPKGAEVRHLTLVRGAWCAAALHSPNDGALLTWHVTYGSQGGGGGGLGLSSRARGSETTVSLLFRLAETRARRLRPAFLGALDVASP